MLSITGKELVKRLQKDGWKLDRTEGSHHILKKEGYRPASIPVHAGKDIAPGTLNKLLNDTGLKGR